MLTLVAVLGRSCAVVPIVVLGLLVGAHEALGCVAINDFVKDVENGKSEKILDSRFTLVDMRKDGLEAVRRYSHVLPYLQPFEIMQVEIVDDEESKAWEQQLGARRLRIRPHAVSHWIDIMPSAVYTDIVDTDQGLPTCKGCLRFTIILAGKGGSLLVGFGSRGLGGKKWQLDQVNLSVRGHYGTSCEE